MTGDEASNLRVKDFEFSFVPKENRDTCRDVVRFIERHEWLGKLPRRPTHRFIATYRGHLAGAVVMATPNSFSNLLGPENRHIEKLISRGACISWSPKNLGSALIMFAIRWMVQNTEFRFFTAYSDTEARELGTIYQACNFIYLGQNSGAREEYFDPEHPDRGWFSDRQFRKTSQTRKYARELRIGWRPEWSSPDKIHWESMPGSIAALIKEQARRHKKRCERRLLHAKHKYVQILGRDKRETERLRGIFRERNPDLIGIPYPKVRGPQNNMADHDTHANTDGPDTAAKPLPKNTRNERSAEVRAFLTVKEVADMLRVSDWTIYSLIKTDPTFPYINIGIKKKLVVESARLSEWMARRSRRLLLAEKNIPTASQLLSPKGAMNA